MSGCALCRQLRRAPNPDKSCFLLALPCPALPCPCSALLLSMVAPVYVGPFPPRRSRGPLGAASPPILGFSSFGCACALLNHKREPKNPANRALSTLAPQARARSGIQIPSTVPSPQSSTYSCSFFTPTNPLFSLRRPPPLLSLFPIAPIAINCSISTVPRNRLFIPAIPARGIAVHVFISRSLKQSFSPSSSNGGHHRCDRHALK
jgi:hypothetical protein